MDKPETKEVSLVEIVAVITLCFGQFIVNSLQAVVAGFPAAGMFSDASLLGLVIWEIAMGACALAFLAARGHRISRLLPSPTWLGTLHGVLLFMAVVAAAWVATSLFPTDYLSAQPVAEMAATAEVSLAMTLLLSVVNGLFEETFLIGYLMGALRASGPGFALGLSLLVRLLYHLYQGPIGALTVLVFGLILGLYYLRTLRLWPVVMAHILADAYAFL